MTLYDIIIVLIVGSSGLIGLVRGTLRELLTALAFVGALGVAFLAMPLAVQVGSKVMDPDWAGSLAAILVVFVVAYVIIRLLGAGLRDRVHRTTAIGAIDRAGGAAFGVFRGLIAVAIMHLVFHAVTPTDRVPQWISGAALYPLSQSCAKALSDVAGRFGPRLGGAVKKGLDGPDAGDEPAQLTTETSR